MSTGSEGRLASKGTCVNAKLGKVTGLSGSGDVI